LAPKLDAEKEGCRGWRRSEKFPDLNKGWSRPCSACGQRTAEELWKDFESPVGIVVSVRFEGGDGMALEGAAHVGAARVPLGITSTPALGVGLAELAEILAMEPPAGLPEGSRRLAVGLREDDEFARRVWTHPMYVALVTWVRERYPDDRAAWEDMAVYALGRAKLCRASRLTAANVRAGMLGTAAWVKFRGRAKERLDRPEPSIESIDVVAEPMFSAVGDAEPSRPESPVEYLAEALRGELPGLASDVLDEAWKIAHDHYLWLADLTGLRGEALLAAGQSNVEVNRHRRLARRLPGSWPTATRKAVVHLLAGTPGRWGLLAWWATTSADEVPASVRSRWRGLAAVIDPTVGGMAHADRRLLREQAQRWQCAAAPDCDRGVAV
jgi:hypothetical protein